jgi:hypothetical protein
MGPFDTAPSRGFSLHIPVDRELGLLRNQPFEPVDQVERREKDGRLPRQNLSSPRYPDRR